MDTSIYEYMLGMDDAVVQFSEMWGKNSEHFKRSLHLIRSSMSETDPAQRTFYIEPVSGYHTGRDS